MILKRSDPLWQQKKRYPPAPVLPAVDIRRGVISGRRHIPFLDRLAEAKQTLWQILPLVPHRCRRPYSSAPPLPATLAHQSGAASEEGLLSEADLQNASVPLPQGLITKKRRRSSCPCSKKPFKPFSKRRLLRIMPSFQAENAYWLADYASILR